MNTKFAYSYFFAAVIIFTFGCKKDNANRKSIGCNEVSSVMDIDGNIYDVIEIGNQCWISENLKVTRYRNGSSIINETDNSQWQNLNNGALCNYDNNPVNDSVYGKLYNWFAATDARGICPEGWHIPSDAEWTILTDYLGGTAIAGTQMKDTTQWNLNFDLEYEATNSSNFTALPGGYRVLAGFFYDLRRTACFWSSSEYNSQYAWSREMIYNYPSVGRGFNYKESGFSCRCLRD